MQEGFAAEEEVEGAAEEGREGAGVEELEIALEGRGVDRGLKEVVVVVHRLFKSGGGVVGRRRSEPVGFPVE